MHALRDSLLKVRAVPKLKGNQIPDDLAVVGRVVLVVQVHQAIEELRAEVTALACAGIAQNIQPE